MASLQCGRDLEMLRRLRKSSSLYMMCRIFFRFARPSFRKEGQSSVLEDIVKILNS